MNVQQVAGTVLVGIPTGAAARAGGQASQKGINFVPLSEAQQIPVGSFLDTRKGTVGLQSATNRAGARQTGKFLEGLFQVRQSKKRSTRGPDGPDPEGVELLAVRQGGPREGRDRVAEPAADQAPARERSGAVPHQWAEQLGDGARHDLGRDRPL